MRVGVEVGILKVYLRDFCNDIRGCLPIFIFSGFPLLSLQFTKRLIYQLGLGLGLGIIYQAPHLPIRVRVRVRPYLPSASLS